MKTLYILALMFLPGALIAQQNADEILASNDVNSGKTEHTLLASQFIEVNAETLDGVYKLLSETGKLTEVRTFEQGKLDGTWLEYDENERLIAIANYKDDQKHGKWIIWDSNGVKRVKMQYDQGKRTGTWNAWNEEGTLISSKAY
jgi:antitoxin component YwqK of YwqJK toxin-antitoxin module